MSYRSFKRVLGETSLERKCRFLFGGCLLVLITGSFWWYGQQTDQLVYKQNRNKGRLLVDTIMNFVHWEHFEEDEDYRRLIQTLSANLQNQQYDWDVILPPRPGVSWDPPTDAFEAEFLDKVRHTVTPGKTDEGEAWLEYDERWGVNRETGQPEYRYYQAVRAKEACITCHRIFRSSPELAQDDLLAIVKVSIPAAATLKDRSWNRAVLIATAIITVFLAMIASYVIVRYVIVKPLKHLRDVSDEISHGNLAVRAEIQTGDEFEELGVAFNRMLQHMIAAQEELRHVNTSLDAKVDELAQANMRFFEMNRLKSDFLATMSHELRTPLNSILGFSEVLESIDTLDDKQKRYVQNIQRSGRMLLEMINDILDLAKIESGKMEVRLTDFRIEHVIGTQCDMARPLTEKKNIDLETSIQPELPELRQDQGKVQQIISNLLSNAIKFTPEGGRIVISARRGSDGLEIDVADTGVGIAEEDQQTIFAKFRQGKTVMPGGDAMTREYSGTGLGLSIVKELCKLLAGEIKVESELGKGSSFTVTLPWKLTEQPKRDSALTESLEDLTRPRWIEMERPLERLPSPQSME